MKFRIVRCLSVFEINTFVNTGVGPSVTSYSNKHSRAETSLQGPREQHREEEKVETNGSKFNECETEHANSLEGNW